MRDDCDEVHGMNDASTKVAGEYRGRQRVTVVADGDWVQLNKGEGAIYPAGLTPAQARYLARKLYRCARLVEQRLIGVT